MRAEPPNQLYILINATVFTLIRYISHTPTNLERSRLFAELARMYRQLTV